MTYNVFNGTLTLLNESVLVAVEMMVKHCWRSILLVHPVWGQL